MKKARAFTLPEVLATLVLIGVVTPVAMQGVSIAMAVASSARHRAEAAALAETKLHERVLDPQSGAVSGTFGEAWPDYRWQASERTVADAMLEVTVEVTWTDRGQERSYLLATWVRQGQGGASL